MARETARRGTAKNKNMNRAGKRRLDQRRSTGADSEKQRTREERKARNRREAELTASSRVSYVKKPFAGRSLICIGLMVVALIFFLVGLFQAVKSQGQAGLSMAAVCFCSILVSLFSIGYGIRSFSQKDKNYILAKIGIGVSGLLMVIWLVMIIIGLRG